jgi:hypothetical protein
LLFVRKQRKKRVHITSLFAKAERFFCAQSKREKEKNNVGQERHWYFPDHHNKSSQIIIISVPSLLRGSILNHGGTEAGSVTEILSTNKPFTIFSFVSLASSWFKKSEASDKKNRPASLQTGP